MNIDTMTESQDVKGRKLTQAYVALTLARNLTKSYMNDELQESNLEPLITVLDVTRDLMDDLLREVFPDVPAVQLTPLTESEFIM